MSDSIHPAYQPDPITFYIAGVQHRPNVLTFPKLDMQYNDELQLVGEPSNKFDAEAVKVYFNALHLGYVPKPYNKKVWELHLSGWKPLARVREFRTQAAPWEMFEVEVTFTREAGPRILTDEPSDRLGDDQS